MREQKGLTEYSNGVDTAMKHFSSYDDQNPIKMEAIVAGPISLHIQPRFGEQAGVSRKMFEAEQVALTAAGSAFHTGVALQKLGIGTGLMGKVGDDDFGRILLQALEPYGPLLTESMIIAVGEASSCAIVVEKPGREHTVIYSPGCNKTFSVNDIRYRLLENIALFHVATPALLPCMYQNNGEGLLALMQQAKERGVTTSLDLSFPTLLGVKPEWNEMLSAVLPSVDVVLVNVETLLFLLRRPLYEKFTARANKIKPVDRVSPELVSTLARTLMEMGPKMVGLKLGHRGFYLRTASFALLEQMGRAQPSGLVNWADREIWAPCFKVDVTSSTGAGDTALAGFLLGLLRGMSPVAALSAACAVGASSVEAPDALSGVRSWPEIMERLAAGWPRLLPGKKVRTPLDMEAFKWRWSETDEVWLGPEDSRY
ncbi:sugar/nucleoside kinase (ribokinase family) [Thermosporothrix hazakensis]|uniref:Sugar/nucleoside kinase (Ribokinase family) n=1 Tax=Thermosporothrix hazakensis TaxID=644383 RepID=A0A326UWI4_THEHA|nr:carbohydrate kinase family protein [Thermosporothrix hazakensis]PZW36703.1 sugar/nucleoside kinase (ribokinase family) [Thermosporothrix hazakensis]